MSKTLHSRLIEAFAEKEGATQAELARACGVKSSSVSAWFSNEKLGLRATSLTKLAAYLGVDPTWLNEGKGEKRPTGERRDRPMNNVELSTVGTRRIPLISYVQAGAWTSVVDSYATGTGGSWLLSDADLSESAFGLEIVGDSMTPIFRPGDKVIIDPAVSPMPGDFVVAKNGSEEATFKKYRPRGINEHGNDVFELVPLNEDYATLRSDVTPMVIIGTMVEHRTYRKR